ncbi:MAG: hypothetical protein S4CHLAM6_02330 [Chlamydiae bacterium]|nr:hypothetical protein [Chlamydiota bacterium]
MINSISPSTSTIEHSVWVKNWGALPDPSKLPPGVNTINIFEGKLDLSNGNWIIDGLNWSHKLLGEYTQACHAKNISVKISLGGAGGQAVYNNTWDQLTAGNVQKMGQDLAHFCKENEIDGIDFDYEEQKSDGQRALVGELIKNFKETNPNLKTSICTSAGNDGTNRYNWQDFLGQILDHSKLDNGHSAVDRIYVMSYDYPGCNVKDNKSFMLRWKDFGEKYGIDPSHISIGVDPTNTAVSEGDRAAYVKFAKDNSFSTAVWDQKDSDEGKYTQQITDEYNKA